jgi:putative inorganic carbon (HCO3(-)) transporter
LCRDLLLLWRHRAGVKTFAGMTSLTLWQRRLILVAIPSSALAAAGVGLDPVNLPKLAVLLAVCAGLIGLALARLVVGRRIVWPRDPLSLTAACLALAIVVSCLAAPNPLAAFAGQNGRATGGLTYLAVIVLLLSAAACVNADTGRHVLRVLAATTGALVVLGLLQMLGVRPLGLSSQYGDVVGTLGNPNFYSAYLGIGSTAVAWLALSPGPRRRQIGFAVLWVTCLCLALSTRSVQGPLVALAGGSLVLLGRVRGLRSPLKERAQRLAVAFVVIGAVTMIGGLAGVGPLRFARDPDALDSRFWYWQAAVAMTVDHPLTGVGMDNYGDYFRQYRPAASSVAQRASNTADQPHNVVLAMFAHGGLLLGGAYVALLLLVVLEFGRAFVAASGERALLLGGLGGAWMAWQIQSMVSLDTPALAALHAVLAGAVLAVCRLPHDGPAMSRRPQTRRGRQVTFTPFAAMLVPAGLALWLGGTLLAADRDIGRGIAYAQVGRTSQALAAFDAGTELVPWRGEYWAERGRVLAGLRQLTPALDAYEEALRWEERNLGYRVTAARLATAMGRAREASKHWDAALELEPQSPELAIEAADFFMAGDEPDRAVELLTRAVLLRSDVPEWWVQLGDAAERSGDRRGATLAYARAVKLNPLLDPAVEGLRRVSDPSIGTRSTSSD